MLERVLANDLALLTDDIDQDTPSLDEPAATAEAHAAVRRLSTVFADASVPELQAILDDPMLALENSTLLDSAL